MNGTVYPLASLSSRLGYCVRDEGKQGIQRTTLPEQYCRPRVDHGRDRSA